MPAPHSDEHAVTVTRHCQACSHEQQVQSAGTQTDADGTVEHLFGSRYDFCDECDGSMADDMRRAA